MLHSGLTEKSLCQFRYALIMEQVEMFRPVGILCVITVAAFIYFVANLSTLSLVASLKSVQV